MKGKSYFYEIDWKTTDKLDKKIKEKNFTACKNELISAAQNLEARILTDWPLHRVKSVKTLLGSAIAHCLSLDEENARKLLSEAEYLMESYRKDIIRYWTLQDGCISLLVFITATSTWAIFRDKIDTLLQFKSLPYVLAIMFGVVGAFFSICLRIGSVDYSRKTGKDIIALETLCRVIIGGISGLIVTLMVMTGVLLPKLQENKDTLIYCFYSRVYWGF